MTDKHHDGDLTELFQSLEREMDRRRGQGTPLDSKAVFQQVLAKRQSRQRRRRWSIAGCASVLLLALGMIGLQMQSGTIDPSVAKQTQPSTSNNPDGPTLAETIANDPEYLAAQVAIAQEQQARLELMLLRNQNMMNAPSFRLDPSLVADLHSKAWQSVEIPDVSGIFSKK